MERSDIILRPENSFVYSLHNFATQNSRSAPAVRRRLRLWRPAPLVHRPDEKIRFQT
jgi:hypothetical protein